MRIETRKFRIINSILLLFIASLSAAQDAPLAGLDDYVNRAIKHREVPPR